MTQLVIQPRELAWQADGACRGCDPLLWYPEIGDRVARKELDKAIAICMGCPVRRECLDYALRRDEKHGVWGGLTTRDRQRLRREQRKRRLQLGTATNVA